LVNWYKKGELLVFGSTIGAILYLTFGVALIVAWYNITTHLIGTKEKYLCRKDKEKFKGSKVYHSVLCDGKFECFLSLSIFSSIGIT